MNKFFALIMLISGFLAGNILHASEEAVKKANAEYRMALADCNEDKAISFVAANYREVGVRGNKLDYAKVQQVAGMLKLAKKLSGPDPKLADMVEMNMLIREQGIMSAEQRQQIEAMENTDAGKKLKQQLSTKVASLILFLENHKKAMKAAWQKHRVISCEVKKNRAKLVYHIPSTVLPGKTEKVITRWQKNGNKWYIYRSTSKLVK